MSLNDVIGKCRDCEREITNSDRFDIARQWGDLSICPSCGGLIDYKDKIPLPSGNHDFLPKTRKKRKEAET